MNIKKLSTVMAGLFSLLAIAFQPAQAVIVTAGAFVDADANNANAGVNDCSGYFGSSFGACNVWVVDGGTTYQLSPVIAKYGYDNGVLETGTAADPNPEINTALYPTIDGSEFSINFTTSDTDGTFTYTQGAGDPGMKYWAAKGGSNFQLFWDVAESVITDGICSGSTIDITNMNKACLDAAMAVTSGTWNTPGSGSGLSHLTFYDTEPVSTTTGSGGGDQGVPEPGALALLGMGLLGMLLARRRYNR